MEKQKCPAVRFNGFSYEWQKKEFKEIFNYERPDNYIVKSTEYLDSKKTPVLTANKGFILGYTDEIETYNKPCIIFDDFTLDSKYVDFSFMVKSSALKILTVQDAEADDLYYSYYLLKQAKIEIMGHARHYIGIVQPTKINVAFFTEQQEISNFFQKLDRSIALHEKKLAQTQNLKKAMLEKMFPKAGSMQPEIRLKGFSGDWDSYSVFSLAQNQKLNNGVFNDQNKVGKGYKLINVLDMYIETSIDENKLTLLDLDRKEFEQNKVKYGDIFFTRSSLVKEGIAFSNVYLGHSNDITYDGHLIKLSPNLELVDPIFLNYCLKSSKVRTQLILGGKSTTMTTIGQQEVGETTVGLPTMSEQLKIGRFFKQLDETLTLQQQQLQTLKNLKQAFLEKMFV